MRRQLEELRQCWAELEAASQARSRRLAEAAAAERLARSFADMEARLGRLEEQLETVGAPPDLRGIGRQLQRLQVGAGAPEIGAALGVGVTGAWEDVGCWGHQGLGGTLGHGGTLGGGGQQVLGDTTC